MNRKVKLCRKSDFQLNQVLNNIDVLFVWFSFFSCFFFLEFLVMFRLFCYLLLHVFGPRSLCFLFDYLYFFYTPIQFFSLDQTILPNISHRIGEIWFQITSFFLLPMRFIWKQLLPHFFPLYEISIIDIIDRIWKWKGRKAVHFNFNTAYHSISVRLRQMH